MHKLRHLIDLVAVATLSFFAFFYLRSIHLLPVITGDNAHFLGLAESIWENGTYDFNGRAHTRFPPGFPFVLGGLNKIFSMGNFEIIQFGVITFFLGLLLAYYLVRQHSKPIIALFAILSVSSSPYFLEYNTARINSDSLGFLLSMLCLCLATWAEKNSEKSQRHIWILLPIFLSIAVMTRSASVALIGAMLCRLFFLLVAKRRISAIKEHWVLLFSIFIAALSKLAWMLWCKQRVKPDWQGEFMLSYSEQIKLKNPAYPDAGYADLNDIALRLFENAIAQASNFSETIFFINWLDRTILSPLILLPILLVIVGMLKSLKTIPSLLLTFSICHLAIFLLWPFDENARFLLPVFPFLCMYLVQGIEEIFSRCSKSFTPYTNTFLTLGLLLTIVSGSVWLRNFSGSSKQTVLSFLFWFFLTFILWAFRSNPNGEERFKTFLRRLQKYSPLIVIALPLLGFYRQQSVHQKHINPPAHYNDSAQVLAGNWLKENTPKNSVLMGEAMAVLHVASRRKAVRFPATANFEKIKKIIKETSVNYLVVIDQPEYPYQLPGEEDRLKLLQIHYPNLLSEVNRGHGYRTFKINANQ